MESQYVHLHSDASHEFYPGNSQSDFWNVWNHPLVFNTDYEVAIAELSYVHCNPHITKDTELFEIVPTFQQDEGDSFLNPSAIYAMSISKPDITINGNVWEKSKAEHMPTKRAEIQMGELERNSGEIILFTSVKLDVKTSQDIRTVDNLEEELKAQMRHLEIKVDREIEDEQHEFGFTFAKPHHILSLEFSSLLTSQLEFEILNAITVDGEYIEEYKYSLKELNLPKNTVLFRVHFITGFKSVETTIPTTPQVPVIPSLPTTTQVAVVSPSPGTTLPPTTSEVPVVSPSPGTTLKPESTGIIEELPKPEALKLTWNKIVKNIALYDCFELHHLIEIMRIDNVINFELKHGRIEFALQANNHDRVIRFNERVCEILGLEPEYHVKTSHNLFVRAARHTAFNIGFQRCMIYTNIIAPLRVGGQYAPLLRIAGYDGVHGALQIKTFEHLQYHPVIYDEIERIHLYIRSEIGEHLPLKLGSVTATLHFRPRK